MRLLLITNRYPVNADDPASPFVPHFAGALTRCGVTVDVLTPDYTSVTGTPQAEDDPAGVSVHRYSSDSTRPVGSWSFLRPDSWVRLLRLIRNGTKLGEDLCESHDYDHILALWALPSGHFARVLARKYGVPYSVWCLGSDIYVWARRPLFHQRIAAILRDASHVFADGHDLCRRVTSWLGIEAAFLPSYRPLTGLGSCAPPRPTESPKYLCLGRLHPDKGIFDLLAAFVDVLRVHPDASLRFVGDGPMAAKLRQHVTALRLTAAVGVLGAASRHEVVGELLNCDCVVIPSRSDSIPLVFTEAVQAMRPVIGTNVGDLGTYIREYGLGAVTPSLDTADLALTMVAMAREPVFDLEGRERLLKEFDPFRTAGRFCRTALGMDSEAENGGVAVQASAVPVNTESAL